ncbi:glycosyltransferase family 2 protein [Rhizobium terrae]|uniref:glycosyltransferase family 2 protein n=1 Tax=Rhizobium terrae TaxID=2171756 RepID=UPI0013C36A8F|nr:glycosyltransferase family 2 protein [Rhizobium terrae]
MSIAVEALDPSAGKVSFTAEMRPISLFRAVISTYAVFPRAIARITKLLLKGNIKGVLFRFARLYDTISSPSYQEWLPAHRLAAKEADLTLSGQNRPSVAVYVEDGPEHLRRKTLASLASQKDCHILMWSDSDMAQLDPLGVEHRALLWMRLPAGMYLEDDALRKLATPFQDNPGLTAVYCDEDDIDGKGLPTAPFFKPAWNPPLALSGWLPLEGALIRLSSIRADMNLRTAPIGEILINSAGGKPSVIHLPEILLHRMTKRIAPRQPKLPEKYDGMPAPVSIVIPTRNRADLLRKCIDSIPRNNDRNSVEIIVIDNDSNEDDAITYLKKLSTEKDCKVISMPGAFNFSKACNLGVREARYENILLLNNDIESPTTSWLSHMIAELRDPDIGAVGALLLFPDGFVQHGGVTLGMGSVARHSYHFIDPEGGEDNGLLAQRRDVSAVTAACLLTTKSLWSAVGGMDEEDLTVAFNDVDYCLKLRRMGKRIIWTPRAKLIHRESVSRGSDDSAAKLSRFAHEERVMHERWGTLLLRDPYYNPNLTLHAESHTLEPFPRDLSGRKA